MSKSQINKNPGFSLIEVMIVLNILSLVFLGLVEAFPYALRISNAGERGTQAAYLAQQKIETVLSKNYDDIGINTIENTHNLSIGNFQRDTVVSYLDGNLASSTTDQGMKKITTTVYYTTALFSSRQNYKLSALSIRK